MKCDARRARVVLWVLLAGLIGASPVLAMPPPDEEEAEAERAPFPQRSAGLAPAGVEFSSPLGGRQWRVSYRFLGTWRTDNYISSKEVGAAVARAAGDPNYVSVPRTRDTMVHVAGLDFAPHERITLLLRVPVISASQTNTSFPPALTPDTESVGIGDIAFGAVVPFMRKGDESTSLSVVFYTPTGSIYKSDDGGQRLAYPMQPGSGSWRVTPRISYIGGGYRGLSWGGQFSAIFTLNENPLGYQLGTEFSGTGWLGWSLGDYVSFSARMEWRRWGNIGGEDPAQPSPFTSPDQDPTRQAGDRVDLGPGLNIKLPCCKGQRFSVEALFPVWQGLEGPQLGNDWVLNANWRMTF